MKGSFRTALQKTFPNLKVKIMNFLPFSFCETVFTPSSVCTHAKTVHGITDMKDYGPFNYLRQTYHK